MAVSTLFAKFVHSSQNHLRDVVCAELAASVCRRYW